MATGTRGVLTHRLRSTHARTMAEIILPVPNQVAPHRNVDPDLCQHLRQGSRDFLFQSLRTLASRPAEQLPVIRPGEVQKALVTAAETAGMSLRFGGSLDEEKV